MSCCCSCCVTKKSPPYTMHPCAMHHDATGHGSHDLSARRARRTKSSRPEGLKAGPKGRKLEVRARRAPRLLVRNICLCFAPLLFLSFSVSYPSLVLFSCCSNSSLLIQPYNPSYSPIKQAQAWHNPIKLSNSMFVFGGNDTTIHYRLSDPGTFLS